jgi:4'-phosphopantetheinyl transferase
MNDAMNDANPSSPLRGEVHVWSLRPEEATDAGLLARYEALLSPDERERQARYVFPARRLQCLLGRALVRTTLSRYADVRPEAWTFRTNPWGRPEIARAAGTPPLRFNLSHAEGWLACAVTLGHEVGVDVEHVGRATGDLGALARRYFAPAEAIALLALPEAEQRERFFAYWTLKESYIKARGMGLALPLDGFRFDLSAPASPAIAFEPAIADRPERWHFEVSRPSPHHTLAVCVERPAGGRVAVRYFIRAAGAA